MEDVPNSKSLHRLETFHTYLVENELEDTWDVSACLEAYNEFFEATLHHSCHIKVGVAYSLSYHFASTARNKTRARH
jgi:hypothetical protein